MSRVSISRRAAQALLEVGSEQFTMHGPFHLAIEELRSALKPKVKKFVKTARKAKAAKKSAKREETSEIRRAVFARAGSMMGHAVCEMCRVRVASDMHHAFGRIRVPQSVTNCLAVCRRCHEEVSGSAASWEQMAAHFLRYGYADEAQRAKRNAYYADSKAELSALSEASR